MAEVIRLKRDQLEKFITDFETLQQFELLFETLDVINSTTVVDLREDVDTNTVNIGVNTSNISDSEADIAALDGRLTTAEGNITSNDGDISNLQATKADLASPSFTGGIGVTGNITVTGTVDGRDVAADGTKLDTIESGAQVNTVDSVAGKTGVVTLDKNDVGLGNVDNTSDLNKPISTATQTALNGKEDTFTKNTAFNKDFGSGTGDVCEGDDSRLSDSRTCDNTFDNAATSRTALDVYSTSEVDTELGGKFDDFVEDSQTPTTGFSITLTQNGNNHWLILTPAAALASGTITLVATAQAVDLQEVMITTTKQISSVTIAGNGGTVYGAPSVLAAESTYKAKYLASSSSWFFMKP